MIKIVKDIKKLSTITENCSLEEAELISKKLKMALRKFGGIGIAANQIGINKSVFIIYHNKAYELYVNPKIIDSSDTLVESTEGCLSFPGIYKKVLRNEWIEIESDNLESTRKLEGFHSFIFQHEFDHLIGKTILS